MFAKAFLQKTNSGKLRHEEQLLLEVCKHRGIPVELYTIKNIHRRNLPLSRDTFIAGDMDAMHGAMAQLVIEIPAANDYPESLRPYMHRRVWKSTLGELERDYWLESRGPVFAKPADRRKNFTGQIFSSSQDFGLLGGTSRRQAVWCTEVVKWISEYRVYVIGDRVVAMDHYAGDADVPLDLRALDEALAVYRESGESPSAYGIDFGVLGSGETALVEANDGYALGAYDIAAEPYAELLFTRWAELLGSIAT